MRSNIFGPHHQYYFCALLVVTSLCCDTNKKLFNRKPSNCCKTVLLSLCSFYFVSVLSVVFNDVDVTMSVNRHFCFNLNS